MVSEIDEEIWSPSEPTPIAHHFPGKDDIRSPTLQGHIMPPPEFPQDNGHIKSPTHWHELATCKLFPLIYILRDPHSQEI